MGYFKHETAIVETESIGDGTRIWAFAHILPGARIGRECNICDQVFIENDVVIGDRVTVKCGVQLWDGVRIEDDVFIGPNATFTNDPFPRSRQRPKGFLPALIKKGASIGANATLLPGLTVGERAVIAAGAVLTHNAPPHAILAGNPARIVGYEGVTAEPATFVPAASEAATSDVKVKGVGLVRLPVVDDIRGMLSFGEIQKDVPFEIKRYFLVFDVPSRHVRGEHAHKKLRQFLVCVHGSCNVLVDDGVNRQEFELDSPGIGVYIPPMVWAVEYKYSPDAVLLVLASDLYDASDYIREYSEFLALLEDPAPVASAKAR
jgi:acetyltransferase-like isoleucine patch superfamily enzyme/dTDP-4-dehydrorhamnose 3,5-epimerase-like enzyme